ncbi:hypothetical protein [Natranaerofaba carboxydovora]|uniref:hypothetical protein n=1 Tax=Natranaerofaba carboxydovora TaxID=2742683 RepID=UPI001F147819|nr:hypothetical protein [Natranaerofaba carboxydovora]UMZ75451.1 hypothetical protein ACONDI_03079 [Natranaerofaba carboxydovora]
MNLVLFVILVAIAIYLYRNDKKDWVEVYEEDEESLNKVQRRIKYLKDKGIKSRLKAPATKGIALQNSPADVGRVKILVKKNDEERARQLLEEYSLEE